MSLGGKDKIVDVKKELVIVGKQEVEVLESLGQDKAVHPILLLKRSNILKMKTEQLLLVVKTERFYPYLDGRESTRNPCILLQGFEGFLPHFEVVWVFRGFVQEIG